MAVTPRWTGTGVEEDADDGQIEFSTRTGCAIGPTGPLSHGRPAIVPIRNKMPPPRMKGYIERGIGLARCLEHQLDRRVHAIEVDPEVRKPVFKADREHTMRALANRPGTQQR